MTKQTLDQLAVRIKRNMAGSDMDTLSKDEAILFAEMGKDLIKLRSVLESFAGEPKPSVLKIYQRFCGGIQ